MSIWTILFELLNQIKWNYNLLNIILTYESRTFSNIGKYRVIPLLLAFSRTSLYPSKPYRMNSDIKSRVPSNRQSIVYASSSVSPNRCPRRAKNRVVEPDWTYFIRIRCLTILILSLIRNNLPFFSLRIRPKEADGKANAHLLIIFISYI